MPKISVIMPVYNVKTEWLKESIESIINQTYSNFEFIIIDDGSDNPLDEIVNSYNDNRIILYRKEQNQGIANAINDGLKIAKGEYIARMDADDISSPERFEKQISYLQHNPNISILGTCYETFPKKSIIKLPQKPKYMDLLEKCCIAHPSVMFRKEDFEQFNLKYNSKYKCEDYELWSRAIRVLEFANLQEILLKYRLHESNCSNYSPEFKTSVIQVRQNMLNYLTENTKIQKKILKIIIPKHLIWTKIYNIIKKKLNNFIKNIKL